MSRAAYALCGHVKCIETLLASSQGSKKCKKHFGKKQKKNIVPERGLNSRPPNYKPTALSITPRETDNKTTVNT